MAEGGGVLDPTGLNDKTPLIDDGDNKSLELERRKSNPIYKPGHGDQEIDWANTSTSTRRGSAPDASKI